MATATLLSPGAQYPLTPHSHSSGYSITTAMPSISMSGMAPQGEPPRPSDSADSPPHRQSLPPISEVISATNSHVAFSQAPTANPMAVPTFSSPFSVPPRPYTNSPVTFEKASSPHTLATYSSRQEPFSAFAEASKAQQFGSLSGPASYSPAQPSPPTNPTRARSEHDKGPEQLPANGGYRHSAPTISFAATGQVPTNQLPYPPTYAVSLSPRHTGPLPPSPYDAQRALRPEEVDSSQARQRYDMNRQMETWSYQDCLLRIASSSRTIFNFAEGYGKLAQEQHTSRPIPERLPTEKEVADMLANVDYIRRSLESVRDVVQQSNRNELAREGSGKSAFDDDDVMMYDSNKQPPYGNSDGKKRRGRAAPPGKCHSCNRVDTPEWRRGPDGARTLCNACGLHYAKLERKRALEARTVGRPRQADDN